MNGSEAQAKLQQISVQRLEKSQAVIETVRDQVPQDSLMVGRVMAFDFQTLAEGGHRLVLGERAQPGQGVVTDVTPVHRHAREQLAERAKVPTRYANELAEGVEWQRDLLIDILEATYGNTKGRYLVRKVNGEVRGFLSDRFRRIDSRPLLDAVVTSMQEMGAVPYGGTVTDTRVSLRAIVPQVIELLPGEHVVFGAEWSNSDFADGKNALRAFFERLVCLNGMTAEDVFAQIHLGRRLQDQDVEFSKKTYDLDQATFVSATRDAVRLTLSPEKREQLTSRIRAAAEVEGESVLTRAGLNKILTKDEIRRAREAFDGPDVVNLPPGNTLWRASNALAWIAQAQDVDPARRLQLERVAGQLMEPPTTGAE